MSSAIAAPDWWAMRHLPQCQVLRIVTAWTGFEIEAAYLRHPKTKQLTLYDYDRATAMGELIALPTAVMTKAGSGASPGRWRPYDLGKWVWPNGIVPEPLRPEVRPQMWSATQRFQAVEDAESAELAREMQGWRDAASATQATAGEGFAESEAEPLQQFWINPYLVTYSPPGRITMREAEGRLMRAFSAEWWIRVEWPRLGISSLYSMVKPEETPLDLPPLRPALGPHDEADMMTALAWLKGAEAREARVLRLRGAIPAMTWAAIGRSRGVKLSGQAARATYERALAAVTFRANGGIDTDETAAVFAAHAAETRRLTALKAARREQRQQGAA